MHGQWWGGGGYCLGEAGVSSVHMADIEDHAFSLEKDARWAQDIRSDNSLLVGALGQNRGEIFAKRLWLFLPRLMWSMSLASFCPLVLLSPAVLGMPNPVCVMYIRYTRAPKRSWWLLTILQFSWPSSSGDRPFLTHLYSGLRRHLTSIVVIGSGSRGEARVLHIA